MKETSISAGLLLMVALGIFYASGVWKKVEFLVEAKLYRTYCEYRYRDPQFCQFAENRIKQIKVIPFRQMSERDQLIARQVSRELFPYYLLVLSILLVFILYRGEKKKTEKKKRKRSVKLFENPELQKAVDNYYSIGGELTDRQIKVLKRLSASDEVKLAVFMQFARENMNFASREVARGIKNETFQKIIFSAGRPSLPPSVFPFYLQAEDLLSDESRQNSEK